MKRIAHIAIALACLAGPGTTKDVNLSDNDGTSSGLQLAYEGGDVFAVWEDTEFGFLNPVVFFSRTDRKRFRRRVELSSLFGNSVGARIAVSGDTVHVVWTDFNSGNGDVFYRRSTNRGDTWGTTFELTMNGSPSIRPAILAEGANVLVLWEESTAGNSDVFVRRSTDGGQSFAAAVNLSNNAGRSKRPFGILDGTRVFVCWVDETSGNDEILVARSTNSGASFQAPVNVSQTAGYSTSPDLAWDGTNLAVAWEDFTTPLGEVHLRISTDGGATFGTTQNLSQSPEGVSQRPRLAFDGAMLHAVWEDDDEGHTHIVHRRSLDGGQTFGVPTIVSVGLQGNSTDAEITAREGLVLVAWKNDGAGELDVYVGVSKKAGETWKKGKNRTKKSGGNAERPSVLIPPGRRPGKPGKPIVGWEADLPGTANRDVFVSR